MAPTHGSWQAERTRTPNFKHDHLMINTRTILISRSKMQLGMPHIKKLAETTDQGEESITAIHWEGWMKQTNNKNNQKKETVIPKMTNDTKHSIQDQAKTVYRFQGLTWRN